MRALAAAGWARVRLRTPRFGLGPQLVALLLVLGLFGAMAIEPTRQLLEQRRRIAGMAQDLSEIERSNRNLEARIRRLKDPDFLEQRAREQIGLIRPGETTYVVMPPSRTSDTKKHRGKPVRRREPTPPEPGLIEGFLSFMGLR